MNAVEQLVIARDQGACARCGRHVVHLERGREWSIHHRRPRGSGGTSLAWVNLPANLVILCGSGTTGCHGWAEAHRHTAARWGFLVSMHGRLRAGEVAVHHATLGLVYLNDEGSWAPADEPTPEETWKGVA